MKASKLLSLNALQTTNIVDKLYDKPVDKYVEQIVDKPIAKLVDM